MCSGLSESEDGGRFRAKGGSCFRAKDGSHCSHLETPKGTPFPGVSFLFAHVQAERVTYNGTNGTGF